MPAGASRLTRTLAALFDFKHIFIVRSMPKIVVTDVDEGPQEDVVAIDGAAKKRKRPLASEPDVAVGKKKSREKEKKEMRAETAATELRQKAPKKAKKEAAPPPEVSTSINSRDFVRGTGNQRENGGYNM